MENLFLLLLVVLMLIAIAGTFVFLLYYVGYFHKMRVAAGPSVVSELQVAYKFHTGNYNACGPHFSEIGEMAPGHRCLGIFYDDPKKVEPNSCRYIVGVILEEGTKRNADPELVQKFEKSGFTLFEFPQVDFSVKTSHPFTVSLSAYFGATKAYPLMENYIKAEKLCAHPFMEIYDEDIIHYMVPLSKQADFYVDEVRDVLKNRN